MKYISLALQVFGLFIVTLFVGLLQIYGIFAGFFGVLVHASRLVTVVLLLLVPITCFGLVVYFVWRYAVVFRRLKIYTVLAAIVTCFTLIFLFFASVSIPREPSLYSTIRANLSSMRAAAEVYAAQSENGYDNFCTSDTVKSLSRSIAQLESSFTCLDSKEEWATEALLISQPGYFCVDSTGFSGRIEASSISESDFSCGGVDGVSKNALSISGSLPPSILKYSIKGIEACSDLDINVCFGSGKILRADLENETFSVYDLVSTDEVRYFGLVSKKGGVGIIVTVDPS